MKNELIKQAEKLQQELDILKNKIKNQEEDDLFNITTYEQVCRKLNEPYKISSYEKIKQIEKLFNGSWKKDWYDKNQKKYYPYFNFNASHGSIGLVRSDYCCYYSFAGGTVYKDEKTSNHVGKHFWEIYKDFITS